MDRQKRRVISSIDGFTSLPPRSRYPGDQLLRSSPVPQQTTESVRPNRPIILSERNVQRAAPSLQPRPKLFEDSLPSTPRARGDNYPATVSARINALPPNPEINGGTAPVFLSSSPTPVNETQLNEASQSLIGSALPSPQYARRGKTKKVHRSKWRSPKRILRVSAITLAVAILGFGGWFASSVIGSVNKVFHGNVFSDAHALISANTLKESGGRVNILLAGDSVGDPHHGGATLADSIMVLSFDPQTKTGFILSIPRDLWVYIPSMGHQKINAANDVANFSKPGYPSGGMGQLQQIVEKDLGIPIDYEALIDYAAFKDAVNAVGGIKIDIQSPDPRGIYDAYTHLKLPNGWVNLNGQQALDLARARGDNIAGDVSYGLPNSDFSRTQHQRQMLIALFKKATTIGVLSNPIKITSLFSAFSNNIQTNLSLGDVISLIHMTNGLNLSNLQSVTYSYGTGVNSLLKGYIDPVSQQDALIPSLGVDKFSQLQQYYQQLISSNPIVRETPTVTVLNASNVVGLAQKEKQLLVNKGFKVLSIADASTEYPTSLIVDNTSGQKPASLAALKKMISGPTVTSTTGSAEAQEAANYTTDFVVLLGKDWDNTTANGPPIQN